MKPTRLVVLGPDAATAAGVFAARPAGVLPKVYVYAPAGADLAAFGAAVAEFNARRGGATDWHLAVRAGDDWRGRFLHEMPGTVLLVGDGVPGKLDVVRRASAGGLSTFAAGPWADRSEDVPRIEEAFADADLREVTVGRPVPDRFDARLGFVRTLLRHPDVAGGGSGLVVAGAGAADLAVWLVAGDEPIDYRRDVSATFVRGVGVRLLPGDAVTVDWNGAKARVRLKGDAATVAPHAAGDLRGTLAAVKAVADDWRPELPGIAVEVHASDVRVHLPPAAPPEKRLAQAFDDFLRTVHFPRSAAAWERSHALAAEFLRAKAADLVPSPRFGGEG